MKMEECPGCLAMFPAMDGPTHRYMESSPGCWEAYGRVLAREYGDPTYFSVHRLSVDTYAVQHPGMPSDQSIRSVGIHLVRLCLFLERGLAPERANAAMRAAAARKDLYRWLDPPPSRGAITVADVVSARTADEHAAAVRAWASSAWDAWSVHHRVVRTWLPIRE